MDIKNEQQTQERMKEYHKSFFGSRDDEIEWVDSPYRICPLGAHVDHQLGLVLGMTIDRGILVAFTPNSEGLVRIRSLNFPGKIEFPIADVPPKTGHWADYARGAVFALNGYAELKRGIDAVISGNMPIGGLSSSAAVGVAYLLALEHVNELDLSDKDNIRLDQIIENDYIGLNNGILDQSTILLSSPLPNSLMFLDCKTSEHEIIRPEKMQDFSIVVVHSGINEVLIDTGYNNRVAECHEAAKTILKFAGKVVPEKELKLRNVEADLFWQYRDKLPEVLRKRATHFYTEVERVRKGVSAWKTGDLTAFGKLIVESGKSSIENYECGVPELIKIYEILNSIDGVYGARFSGAGFRGACIGLVDSSVETQKAIRNEIAKRYPKDFPMYADRYEVHFCGTNGRARVVTIAD